MKHWFIDGRIDLTGVCEDAGWHLATATEALRGLGLDWRDAEAFADFAFAEKALVKDGSADFPLSDEQEARLSRR